MTDLTLLADLFKGITDSYYFLTIPWALYGFWKVGQCRKKHRMNQIAFVTHCVSIPLYTGLTTVYLLELPMNPYLYDLGWATVVVLFVGANIIMAKALSLQPVRDTARSDATGDG